MAALYTCCKTWGVIKLGEMTQAIDDMVGLRCIAGLIVLGVSDHEADEIAALYTVPA
jgi:hypothetical protein